MASRESVAKPPPKEQPPPESLRPKDRARLDSLESVRRRVCGAGRRRGKALRR